MKLEESYLKQRYYKVNGSRMAKLVINPIELEEAIRKYNEKFKRPLPLELIKDSKKYQPQKND